MIVVVAWAARVLGIPEVRVVDEGSARVSGFIGDVEVEAILPDVSEDGLDAARGVLDSVQALIVTPEQLACVVPGRWGVAAGRRARVVDVTEYRVSYALRMGPTIQTGSVAPSELPTVLAPAQTATIFVPATIEESL